MSAIRLHFPIGSIHATQWSSRAGNGTTIWCVAEVCAAFAGGSVDGHTVGRTFRDCKDYCGMVVIPQGKFTIGTLLSEKGRGNEEIRSRW
jgi:hypothetical protein